MSLSKKTIYVSILVSLWIIALLMWGVIIYSGKIVRFVQLFSEPKEEIVRSGEDIPQVYLSSGESNLVAQIGLLAKKRPVQVIKARFWHPIGYPEYVEKAEYFIRLPAARRLN